MQSIHVAHSPDADDIFMYYPIVFGWIDTPVTFHNTALDIQTLNALALQKHYEVTAISFALYPLIAQDYALLETGLSFGQGYGPMLIKKRSTRLKSNFKVALSGKHTTNALLFKLRYPQAKIIYKNFLEIESSILSGEVDAGVLIHESILTFDPSLAIEAHLWDIWLNLIGKELPLPLGGMAISRSLPLTRAIAIQDSLQKAVKIATRYQDLLSSMLLDRALVRVNAQDLKTYLHLYANANSISLSDIQLQAIDALFALGYDHKLYPDKISSKDHLLPTHYTSLRYS